MGGGAETPVLEDADKILHTPRPPGKEQLPHRTLNQNYLLMLEGLLRRPGLARAHLETEALTAAVLGGPPCHKSSWRSPLTLP